MYYSVTKIKDAEKLHRIYPNIPIEDFRKIVSMSLEYYRDSEPAIYVSDNEHVKYCDLEFYRESPGYGEQGYLYNRIKYNKEQVCVK